MKTMLLTLCLAFTAWSAKSQIARTDTLIQLAFDTSYIVNNNIHKIEADLKTPSRMPFTSRFTYGRHGKLLSYERIENGETVYSRNFKYDKKNRVHQLIVKDGQRVVRHKYTYSKDNKMYESAILTERGKVGRLLGGGYSTKIFDRYVDLDSLGRPLRSLTYRFERNNPDYTTETSISYSYSPTHYLKKQLNIDATTGKTTVHFHRYQFERDEQGKVICAEYQHNRDPKQVIEYVYKEQWIDLYLDGREMRYWNLPWN